MLGAIFANKFIFTDQKRNEEILPECYMIERTQFDRQVVKTVIRAIMLCESECRATKVQHIQNECFKYANAKMVVRSYKNRIGHI